MLRFDATKTAVTCFVACCAVLPATARADTNDCGVTVAVVGTKPVSTGLEVTFRVTNTKCEASAGRFGFTYRTSARPGIEVPQNATGWTSAKGKSFEWAETIAAG